MRELDPIRRLAPPAVPLAPDEVARIRSRALAPRRRRVPAAGLIAPLVGAAALALVVLVWQPGGGQERAFAAEVVRAAEGAPRLLVDGWAVTRVDEWNAGTGEMTFSQGSRELDLSWSSTRASDGKLGAAKDPDADVVLEVDVPGSTAVVHRYAGSDDYTAVWRSGDVTVQARALAASPGDFAGVLRRLAQVGAEDWLRALPAGAVTPREHPDIVDEMLAGLPLPPGLDVAALRPSAETRDRYQLGARVAGAVACGWIALWVEARAAGDEAGAQRATTALASARDWSVLREMQAEGDYPRVLWQYADAVASDGTIDGGRAGMSVAGTYRNALCG